jgi:Flp pilus assembly protein TadB
MLFTDQGAVKRARLIAGNLNYISGSHKEGNSKLDVETIAKLGILHQILHLYKEAGFSDRTFVKSGVTFILLVPLVGFVSMLTRSPLVLFLSIIFLGLWLLCLSIKANRRAQNFEKDYPAFLISLSSAVRTGLDPLVAFKMSSQLFGVTSELSRAIHATTVILDSGVSEKIAFSNFAIDIRHPDIELFRSAFVLARSQGASLGECLHRLAKVTRLRQSFRRKTRSAVAMQKLSSLGICTCAVAIGFIQYTTNPKAIADAIEHPIGYKILMVGTFLILAGVVWMFSMTRTRV